MNNPSAKPPLNIVLVLQGGGALGAYQAGVYEQLSHTHYTPNWVAGISIGAINAALIVGNPPHLRVARLREFWHRVSSHFLWPKPDHEQLRAAFNWSSAMLSVSQGIPGFYSPRFPGHDELSVYDTRPLRATLEELVDFDLINSGSVRLSVGAVNIRTGNSVYFDNTQCRIGPEHIMASGALPPAFAPVEIDGELYWDGGIVSNTPLSYVLDRPRDHIQTILQVDLFSARGAVPNSLTHVMSRHKDIMYSSRTRFNTDMITRLENLQHSARELIHLLPDEHKNHPAVQQVLALRMPKPAHVVHLIYRPARHVLDSKDYEFSRASVELRWQAGMRDLAATIEHPDWLKPTRHNATITTYDLRRPPHGEHR
jgi:NTE family protein